MAGPIQEWQKKKEEKAAKANVLLQEHVKRNARRSVDTDKNLA